MAITVDPVSIQAGEGTSVSVSHTIPAGTGRLLVIADVAKTTVGLVSDITYGGISLPGFVGVAKIVNKLLLEAWAWVDPPVGTATAVVTNGASCQAVIVAMSFSGVDTGVTPPASSGAGSGVRSENENGVEAQTSLSLAWTNPLTTDDNLTAGDTVICLLGVVAGIAATEGAEQTELAQAVTSGTAADRARALVTRSTAVPEMSHGWTFDAAADAMALGFALAPLAAGEGGLPLVAVARR